MHGTKNYRLNREWKHVLNRDTILRGVEVDQKGGWELGGLRIQKEA